MRTTNTLLQKNWPRKCYLFLLFFFVRRRFEKSKSLWKNRVDGCSFRVYVHKLNSYQSLYFEKHDCFVDAVAAAADVAVTDFFFLFLSFVRFDRCFCCYLFLTNERYFCPLLILLSMVFCIKLYTIASLHITFLAIIFHTERAQTFRNEMCCRCYFIFT